MADTRTRDRPATEADRLLLIDAEVTRSLAAGGALRDVLHRTLEIIVAQLGIAFARVWTLDETEAVLEQRASAGQYLHIDGVHDRIPVGRSEIGMIAATRTPHLTNQVSDDPVIDRAWARREGMVAFAGHPLVVDDRLIGVLGMFSRTRMSDATLVAIETISRSIAQAIDRRRIDAQLRARELWLSTTLNSIGDAVIATDAAGVVTYMNAVASQLTGWTLAEARGLGLGAIFPIFNEETGAPVENPVDKVLREGRIVGLACHTVLRHRDGHLTPIEDSAAPIHAPGEPLTGIVLVFRNATELRRAEAERERAFGDEQAARRTADERERQLAALIATAPIAIVTWEGPEHRYKTANELSLEYMRRGPEILGQRLADALPAFLNPGHVLAAFDAVYRTGVPLIEPELRIAVPRERGPEERIYSFNLVPTYATAGTVDGLMACVIDVTQGVRARMQLALERDRASSVAAAEHELRGRSDFLLAVAGSLSQGLELPVLLQRLVDAIAPARAALASVWLIDPGRQIHRAVHAPQSVELGDADAAVGAAAIAAVGTPLRAAFDTAEIIQCDDLGSLAAAIAPQYDAAVRKLALRHAAYFPILRGDRVAAVLSIARREGRPFTPDDLRVFEAVAHQASFVFDNARLYAESNALRGAAEAATLEKDRFLSQVSHDLRNPLGSILGWATLLRQTRPDPAQLAKGMEVIERNAKAQVELIEDLLDVSRITAGKLKLALTNQDVHEAIDTALDPARIAAEAKRVHLRVEIDPDVGSVIVDPDRFRQVMWNLVSNAVKFTPSGGTVAVSASREASKLKVSVVDSGRGISPEFLPRVFDRFEQADQGAKRSGGLGLGLTIVKHITELHGGTAEVHSAGLGQGATFTIRFPIQAAIPPGTDDDASAMPASRALGGREILVVDDEDDARDVVAAILRNAGASVTAARSVDEALAIFRSLRPAVVVSDIGMPEQDGMALARAIRALPARDGGATPAVALTALARARDRIQVLTAGFDSHVAKPVAPDELIAVLVSLLGRPQR